MVEQVRQDELVALVVGRLAGAADRPPSRGGELSKVLVAVEDEGWDFFVEFWEGGAQVSSKQDKPADLVVRGNREDLTRFFLGDSLENFPFQASGVKISGELDLVLRLRRGLQRP
ncbi:MAG: hypothetical protein Kow0069_26250 [Promethearchaeota archaeon]